MASDPSTLDRIKFVFGAMGTIIGGAVIASGPGTMPNDIPFHIPLGLTFIAVGVLMFVALFSTRVKSLLVGLVVGLFSAGGLFVAFAGNLNILHAWLVGIVSALASLYAVQCFVSVFTGKDST